MKIAENDMLPADVSYRDKTTGVTYVSCIYPVIFTQGILVLGGSFDNSVNAALVFAKKKLEHFIIENHRRKLAMINRKYFNDSFQNNM